MFEWFACLHHRIDSIISIVLPLVMNGPFCICRICIKRCKSPRCLDRFRCLGFEDVSVNGRCASYPLSWLGALCVLTAAWLKKNTSTYSQASQENSCCTHMFLESQQPSHSIHRLGYIIMPDSPQEIACRSYEGVMKPLICPLR